MRTACLLALAVSAASPSTTVEVFQDKGDVFIRAGSRDGVRMGAEVVMLGDTIANTAERRTVGKASVMEVWETIARIRPDAAAVKAKSRHARLDPPVAAADTAPATASAPPPAKAPAPSGPSRAGLEGGKSQVWSSGFSDHLIGVCEGVGVRVLAKSTLTGGAVQLVLNNELVDTGDVSVGGSLVLRGEVAGKPAVLKVSQGLLGTDYALTLAGKSCGLHDR